MLTVNGEEIGGADYCEGYYDSYSDATIPSYVAADYGFIPLMTGEPTEEPVEEPAEEPVGEPDEEPEVPIYPAFDPAPHRPILPTDPSEPIDPMEKPDEPDDPAASAPTLMEKLMSFVQMIINYIKQIAAIIKF